MRTLTRRVVHPLALAAALGAALAGCATTEPIAENRADPWLDDDRSEPLELAADEALSEDARAEDALAAQAARDVEALRQARTDAAMTRADPPGVDLEPAPTAPTAIDWTDPASRLAAASLGVEFDDPAAQPPLAREEGELVAVAIDPAPQADEAGAATALEPDALRPHELERLLLETRRQLYRASRESDMPLREMVLVAAMSVVAGDAVLDESAIHAIDDLTEEEKALLRQLQDFFRQLGERLDGSRDAQEAVTEAVADLRATLVEMRLSLGAAALCRRVVGFGDIEAFGRNEQGNYAFLAHNEQQVIVYLEVDDFTSELNERDEWMTELSQQLTIYSERDGIPVWKAGWQTAIDRSTNRRRDFFTVQVVTLPKALSVGRYQLKIRVRDDRSGAETEGGLAFEMVADEKMVGGRRD